MSMFEKMLVGGASFSDIDQEKLREYFRRRAPGAEEIDHLSLAELAIGQGFMARINGDSLQTVAGAMLFGKSPQKHNDNWGITAIRVRGADITFPIVDRRELTGTAEFLIDRGWQFVADHLRTAYEFPENSMDRREIAEYPAEAVREALANAVAHRDYQPSERIQVRQFDDRLEIQNPGGLLPGLKIEQILRTPTPRRRNHLIAQVLLEWKKTEQVGRGLMRIQRAMRDLGSSEPRFETSSSHFIVTLPSRHGV
jgi:ATP-dependent DNA helicase RecG